MSCHAASTISPKSAVWFAGFALTTALAFSPARYAARHLSANPSCGQPQVEDYYDYDYPDPDHDDPYIECGDGLGIYQGLAESKIDSIKDGFMYPECSNIKYALLYETQLKEWTGWYDDPVLE